jgi:hypothetical protein
MGCGEDNGFSLYISMNADIREAAQDEAKDAGR